MPKTAMILPILAALALSAPASHAFYDEDLAGAREPAFSFASGIFDVPPEAYEQAGLKRFLILGQGGAPAAGPAAPQAPPAGGFFSVALLSEEQAAPLRSRGHLVMEDILLEYDSAGDASRIGQITNSAFVNEELGYSGDGVTVAVVDTGVDFSNPDVRESLARDGSNHPVMLDADGQGIVLTNATFHAFIDQNGVIRNHTRPLPENATSSVYRTGDGVFLDISQGGNGTQIQIYNSFFPLAGTGPVFNGTLTEDMKIGESHRDYIRSKSGIYHLGLAYQGATDGRYPRVQVVPVLVTDPNAAGVYDTVTPDMTTSWEDYTRFDLGSAKPDYDFDFTDERPVVLGSGNEFLVLDSDGDGADDYSAGTVGARVLDVYGAVQNGTAAVEEAVRAVNGTLLMPIDPDGNYFGIMADFQGHGTSSAASIASRGVQEYDIYNDTGSHSIRGVAPDAKIIPVKSLWFGDALYSWLWAAGFDNDDARWEFSGRPRADVISNSWGVSNFPAVNAAPGMDVLSLMLGALSTPHSLDDDYPGVLMVTSAGNSGPGYGTMGMPNASPFGVSVGATTNNVFVGYGPFRDQPRFGNTTEHHGHVADFSSRGPGIIGDPKPDLMSVGAHGFTPSNVLKLERDSKLESFSLFGGTSMAAPLASGAAALLIQAMNENGMEHDPFVIKNILMSTAADLKNDALTQGSGLVDARSAIGYVRGEGAFVVHNNASFRNIMSVLEAPLEGLNSTMLNLDRVSLPGRDYPMTGWFAGRLSPNERSTATFTIENPTDAELRVSVSSSAPGLVQRTTYEGRTEPLLRDRLLDGEDAYRPNYVGLHDVRDFSGLGSYFDDGAGIPVDSDLLVLSLNFPFDEFMNKTHDVYAEELSISSLYLYDWTDGNNNTQITSDELSMVTRGGSWGTVQELRVTDPAARFEGTPVVGVYPVPAKFSFWTGSPHANSTSMNYTLTSSYYRHQDWEPLWIDRREVTVPAGASSTVDVTAVVPGDYETGVYQGFLRFSGQNHTASVPVTFAVTETVTQESDFLVGGAGDGGALHSPGFVKGAFDMANRYMAGDWRQYYFDIRDPDINAAAVEFSWEHGDTNLAVFAVDPAGQIIRTNVPSGVFGHFMGWPSLDWLGTSPFSQGGGFFPAKNKDDTSTVLYVPINRTGTHTLLVHSTLFAGMSITEPVTLSAKFTTVDRDGPPPSIRLSIPPTVDDATVVRPQISDDDLEAVLFYANSTRLHIKDGALDLAGLGDGYYVLTVTASDAAGNYSTENFSFTKTTASGGGGEAAAGPPAAPARNGTAAQAGPEQPDGGYPAILSVAVPVLIAVGIAAGVFIKLGNPAKG